MPDPICPSIEMLVHRRASELVVERPRHQRRLVASSLGGVAVAAVCAVLFLVIGSSSGGGLLSPQRAIAAVTQSLEGDGVLHWVWREEVETRDPSASQMTKIDEDWVDLTNGDSHRISTTFSARESSPQRLETWRESGNQWTAMGAADDGTLTVERLGSPNPTLAQHSIAEEVRLILERAEQRQADTDLDESGVTGGTPLVVVKDRLDGVERELWITRDETPRIVRLTATNFGAGGQAPVTTTATTLTWEVLPRNAATLAQVEIPATARRRP